MGVEGLSRRRFSSCTEDGWTTLSAAAFLAFAARTTSNEALKTPHG